MKPLVTFELGKDVDERTAQLLAGVPHFHVRRGRTSRLRTDTDTWPLRVGRGIAPYAKVTAPALAQTLRLITPGTAPTDERAPITVIVAERLLPAVRRELEDADLSYVDGAGAVHLQAPGLLVHLEPGPRTRTGTVPDPRGIGVTAIRVIQHLLTDPTRVWTVTELAAAADASLGQAHKVLTRLDTEGFIEQQRAGKAVLRRLTNPTDVLDWLAQAPAARKLPRRLKTHLYAPDPDAVITRLARAALNSETDWALTGAAGARVWGATRTITALPVTMVRVDPDHDLHDTAARLGLEPVDGGHNVLLVADVGRLATQAPERNGPVVIAPKVRVWLDMLTETRGQDAADLFRESALGY